MNVRCVLASETLLDGLARSQTCPADHEEPALWDPEIGEVSLFLERADGHRFSLAIVAELLVTHQMGRGLTTN